MKCLFLEGAESVAFQERELPQLSENDVLVKLESRGICGTDLHSYRSGNAMGFGHEMGGRIVKTGGKSPFSCGMKVFVSNLSRNLMSYCPEIPNAYLGGFADYILVKNAQENVDLYPVPESMTYSEIALIEPFCVGMSGAKKYSFHPESHVVILGAGIIGMCAFEYLKSQGVKKIVVADIVEARLKRVKNAGGIPLNTKEKDMQSFLTDTFGAAMSLTAGMVPNVDVYIDAAGVSALSKLAISMMKSGGQLTVLAVHHQPFDLDMVTLMYNNVRVMGSCMFTPDDILEAIDIISKHPDMKETMITHEIPFNKADEAFKIASDASTSLKVMLVG